MKVTAFEVVRGDKMDIAFVYASLPFIYTHSDSKVGLWHEVRCKCMYDNAALHVASYYHSTRQLSQHPNCIV